MADVRPYFTIHASAIVNNAAVDSVMDMANRFVVPLLHSESDREVQLRVGLARIRREDERQVLLSFSGLAHQNVLISTRGPGIERVRCDFQGMRVRLDDPLVVPQTG